MSSEPPVYQDFFATFGKHCIAAARKVWRELSETPCTGPRVEQRWMQPATTSAATDKGAVYKLIRLSL